jgi:hypothetical protein
LPDAAVSSADRIISWLREAFISEQMKDYQDSISAKNASWKSDARRLMESGVEFVVVHLESEDIPMCRGLAQEFEYDCCLEDKSPALDETAPQKRYTPTALGFVKRGSIKVKPD